MGRKIISVTIESQLLSRLEEIAEKDTRNVSNLIEHCCKCYVLEREEYLEECHIAEYAAITPELRLEVLKKKRALQKGFAKLKIRRGEQKLEELYRPNLFRAKDS